MIVDMHHNYQYIFNSFQRYDVMSTQIKGNIAIGKAISYFTENEYTVNIPLNDSQWYDLIVERDNIFHTVQVKYTSETNDSGSYKVRLTTTSGTSRKVLYSIKDTMVEWLFCYCSNGDMYLIPTKDFSNHRQINLSRKPSSTSNKNTVNSYKYLLN